MRVLLAENDREIQGVLKIYLENEECHVTLASTEAEALDQVETNNFDLIILDQHVMTNEKSLLREKMERHKLSPEVLIFTNNELITQEISTNGENIYSIKSLDLSLFLTRVKKVTKIKSNLVFKDVTLNPELYEVRKSGNIINLTKKEYDLLLYFMSNINIILSREQILNRVWGMNYVGDRRVVDTYVKRVRKKIGDNYITTKIGIGYVLGTLV